jgi:hypothetical protein
VYLFGVEGKQKIATVANKINFCIFGLNTCAEKCTSHKKSPLGRAFLGYIFVWVVLISFQLGGQKSFQLGRY